MGQPEEAMRTFDLGFANGNPKESNLLLLITVCDPYKSQASDTPSVYPLGHHVICSRETRHSHLARS